MKMKESVFARIKEQLEQLTQLEGGFYQKKLAGLDLSSIQSQEDFENACHTLAAT